MKRESRMWMLAVVATVLAISVASTSHAATINVNPGESIQNAVGQAAPGDIVVVAAGTYSEDLNLSSSGSQGNPITLQGPGATLQGSVDLGGDWWIIQDLKIEAGSSGDAIQLGGSHNTLERIDLSGGTRDGIDGAGTGNQILDSAIYNFDTGTPGNDAHCIVLNPGAQDWTIRGNRIWDCSGDGIQLYAGGAERSIVNTVIEGNEIYYDGSTGVGFTENAIDIKNGDGLQIVANRMYGFSTNKIIVVQKGPANIDVRCNVMSDSERGPEFRSEDGGQVENVNFSHNLVFNIAAQYSLKFDDVANVTIYNNTFADSPSGDGLRIEGAGILSGTVRNNLWANTGSVDSGNFDADHNGFFQANTQIGSPSDVTDDPQFATNFELSSGSPMIDKGVDVGLPFGGSAPDLGYHEVGGDPCQPAGTGGSGGSGTGGSGGGTGGSGTGGGTAGSGTGGGTSGGSGGGTAGSGTGGAPGSGGASGAGTYVMPPEDEGGCGCHTPPRGQRRQPLLALLALGALLASRRRA